MDNNDLKRIAKVALIAGVALCGIAQILPWGEISVGGIVSISFFHWGGQLYVTPSETVLFLTPTNFSGISGSPALYSYAAATLLLYFILPSSLISLVAGIVAYRKVGKKRSKNSLHAAILSLAAIILFVIFIYLSLLSLIGEFASYYRWSTGFYLMIVSTIIFFIAYIVIKKIRIEGKNSVSIKDELEKQEERIR